MSNLVIKAILPTLLFLALILPAQLTAQVGELIWEENFENLDNWIIETGNGSWGWGNGELQYYKSENISITTLDGDSENSVLKIVAKQESGPDITDQWGNPLNYTSGPLNTTSKVSVLFGMIETRIQVPDLETGGWPAFWMLGTSNYNWPNKGELDLMEMGHKKEFRDARDATNGGNDSNNSSVNSMIGANAIFYSDDAVVPDNPNGAASLAWDQEFARPYFNLEQPLNDRFLIYRMYWDTTSIRFTVIDEGMEYDLFEEPFPLSAESDEFLHPFYFVTNMAIGGTLTDAYQLGDPGSGQAVSMNFPSEMLVDYIRVYEWNGQGSVTLGPPEAENETFGLYTDSTSTNNKLLIDEDAHIYVWEGTLEDGTVDAFEGENGISWRSTGSGWFGAGIMSVQPVNLSNFSDGFLKFSIKIPAGISFQIGVIDAWGNQNYVDFPANTTTYGLTRNGEWGQASIPVSDLRGEFIDMRMLTYEFVILEVNGAGAEFGLDDIYYEAPAVTSNESFEENETVSQYELFDNYPNPFNPTTTFSYNLPTTSFVELSIFDVNGREISSLVSRNQPAGNHTIQWNASNLSSGIYFYRLKTNSGFVQTKKMILLK